MVTTNYSFKNFDDHTAKAYGSSLDISTKAAISICNVLRGMDAKKAIEYLQAVVDKKKAVPFTRFTDGVGHRKGRMASGRYPVKAATRIGKLVAAAMANAAAQGMDDELKIVHIAANKASTPLHQGRQIRRSMKRTHVEVVLREDETRVKAKQSQKKQAKKSAAKKSAGKQEATKKSSSEQSSQDSSKAKQASDKSSTATEQSTKQKADEKSSEVSQ